jgi:hypothetical protein
MISPKQMDEMVAIRREMQALLQRIDAWMAAVSAEPSSPVVSAPAALPQIPVKPAERPQQPSAPRPAAAPVNPSSRAFHSPYSQVLKGKSDEETKPPEPIAVASGTLTALRSAAEAVLTQAAKPLSFNAIYTKLSELGAALPADKPMLVLRKILSDRTMFSVTSGGLYALVISAAPAESMQAAPARDPAQPPAPQNNVPLRSVSSQSPAGSDFTNKLNRILGQ